MAEEMTEKEAIELFEKTHTLQEQWKMGNDIQDISNILSQRPINMYQIKAKIKKVNDEHPENTVLFNLIFPPQGKRVSLIDASAQNLIDDLTWKQDFLQMKKNGKLFDELCKEKRKRVF